MALCVQLQPDGTLVPTGQTSEECTGYVLVTPAEHAWSALLHEAFAWPEPTEAATLMAKSFGGVLLFYIVAYICGAVGRYFD
jgi:hypothetical protein